MGFNTGVFNTTQNPSELNVKSFAGQILRRFPNGTAPIFALTSQSGKSKAKSSTHGYFSKTMSFLALTSSAALVDATTIAMSSAAGITKNMVFHNVRTRENVRVTADATHANNITVQRAYGRIAAAAINNADKWIMIGTSFEEGSVRPTARRMTTVYVANYTQIFRNAWALTDTARASLTEAGYSNIVEDRNDCSLLHAQDAEASIIWGQPKMDTSGAQPVHSTQGILDALLQYAPTNVNPAGATTNYSELVELVEPAFSSSTNLGDASMRVGFVDNTAMKIINDIGRLSGQVQITNNQTQFGLRYTSFQFYNGTVNLMIHPLLNGLQTGGMAILMDMSAIKLAYLDGRDTKVEEYNTGGKVVENGVDAVGGSLTTEFAVELVNPNSCAIITGFTSAAAE